MPSGDLSETASERFPLRAAGVSSGLRSPSSSFDTPCERVDVEGRALPINTDNICAIVGEDDCRTVSSAPRLLSGSSLTHDLRTVPERGLQAVRESNRV